MIRCCKVHGETDFSTRVTGKYTKYECKKCKALSVKKFSLKRKIEMINYKGGVCCKCGYNKNLAALEFHHINPEEKLFELSYHSGQIWETITKELDKCLLLCANCHKEIHNPIMESSLLNYHTKDKTVL